MAEPPARSRAARVFADLRSQILGGRFAPGTRLSPRALATANDVSVSVVREVLTRLAEQGLVTSEPQFGFSVVQLDMAEVRDLSRVRVLIEGEALRDAVRHASAGYEADVLAAHHLLSRTPSAAAPDSAAADTWSAAHADFHRALISGCSSPRLRDLANSLRDMTELYRRWSLTLQSSPSQRDAAAEHQALLDAVLDHDPDRAVAVSTDHITITADLLAAYAESRAPATPDAARRPETV
jgi:DNA-binding GntR family transcriptional regulator